MLSAGRQDILRHASLGRNVNDNNGSRTYSMSANILTLPACRKHIVLIGEIGWVGFLVLCFLYKVKYQPTNNYLLWAKSGPNTTFNLIFLGLGWPWVGEFVDFIIILVCFPTQHN